MRADFLPFRVRLLAVSGWVHREQQGVIEYLFEENRVLREQIGNRRLPYGVNTQPDVSAASPMT